MDDKRIKEWANGFSDALSRPLDEAVLELLEDRTRELLSEAIAEYKEDALRFRWLEAQTAKLGGSLIPKIDAARKSEERTWMSRYDGEEDIV